MGTALADPRGALETLPGPRRAAIGRLLAELGATTRALAGWYAGAAAGTRVDGLRTGLEALAAAKTEQLRILEPLVEALVGDASPAPSAEAPAVEPTERGAVFSRAFPAERALGVGYRELTALVGDPARCPDLAALAARSAEDREILRRLYLRYS